MWKTKGFIPYIFVVFFNAFIDLGHKILLQDTLYNTSSGYLYTILSAIINAFILIPFVLLFTPSGFIADRFAKSIVIRVTAAAAIPVTLILTACYYYGLFWVAFAGTLLLSIQSALNSPAKYGYIKEHFGKENLAQVNAFVQTTVILAILGGTIIFTILFSWLVTPYHFPARFSAKSEVLQAFYPLGFLLVLLSVSETIFTFFLPRKEAVDPGGVYDVNKYIRAEYLKSYLIVISKSNVIITCIIGLGVYFAVNQVLLASYGTYLKAYVPAASVVFAQGSLAVAGIGVLLGALYAGRVSRGFIETGIIPVGAIGVTLGLFTLPHLTSQLIIVIFFFIYGFFGGMLLVPLNALIQFTAKHNELGKVLAANNFIQNIFMIGFLVATVLLTLLGADSIFTLHALSLIALVATLYAFKRLPQSLVRYIIYFIVSKFHRIQVVDLANLPSQGGVLLLGNHISFLDWAIVQIASPRPIRFVMEHAFYTKWYLTWFLDRVNVIPISSGASREAIATIRAALKQGDIVALFPEGRLSRNGQMGVFRSGFEKAMSETGATVIPFYIHGLWGSAASYAPTRYK